MSLWKATLIQKLLSDILANTEPVKESPHNAIKNAIVNAFGWDTENVTQSAWGAVGKATKELVSVGASPDDIPKLYHYCNKRFDNFGVMALAKYYADWKGTQPKPHDPDDGIYAKYDDESRAQIHAIAAENAAKAFNPDAPLNVTHSPDAPSRS